MFRFFFSATIRMDFEEFDGYAHLKWNQQQKRSIGFSDLNLGGVKMNPVIIIPALNPDEKLVSLVEELQKQDLHTIVVDDGSGTEHAAIFGLLKSKYASDICTHPSNCGKGRALKTGISFLLDKYPECPGFLTADADGQHAVKDIKEIADMLSKNEQAFVLGVRNFKEPDIPLRSRVGNRMTSAVFRAATGVRCQDTQTGLRGVPMRYADLCLGLPGERYEYEMNMLMTFAANKIPFKQVPIETIYIENNRASHFDPIKDSVRIYWNILKYGLSSALSALLDLFLFGLFSTYLFPSITETIGLATLLARCISGSVNFILNKQWVFQNERSSGSQGIKYGALFIAQLVLSGLLVELLSGLSIPLLFVKAVVDAALFFASYAIQKKYIFNTVKKGQIIS